MVTTSQAKLPRLSYLSILKQPCEIDGNGQYPHFTGEETEASQQELAPRSHCYMLGNGRARTQNQPAGQPLPAPPRKGKKEQVLVAGCEMSNQRKGPKRSWSVGAERGGHGAEWRGWEQLGPRQEVLQSIALGTEGLRTNGEQE